MGRGMRINGGHGSRHASLARGPGNISRRVRDWTLVWRMDINSCTPHIWGFAASDLQKQPCRRCRYVVLRRETLVRGVAQPQKQRQRSSDKRKWWRHGDV